MSLKLAIQTSVNDPNLATLTQDFCDTLNKDAGIHAAVEVGTPMPGKKGEPITLGVLALAFVTSGAATALFNTIKSYFDRSQTLTITLEGKDKLTMTSHNVSAEERERTLKQLREFLDRQEA